jgi:lipoprotein-releasing system ATP-binding protein
MSENSRVLVVEDLHKVYNSGESSLVVLKNLSLRIDEPQVVTIVGRSGSGKTTLLNIIGGLDVPTSGRVVIHGYPLVGFSEDEISDFRSNHVGFVFQFHNLLSEFTSLENVMMPALIRGGDVGRMRKRARDLLDRMGIGEKENVKPGRLSGGESQRVAIARALINRPDVILADEPTGNLDVDSAGIIKDTLFEVSRNFGHTLIVVTHNPSFVQDADARYRLDGGRLIPLHAPDD